MRKNILFILLSLLTFVADVFCLNAQPKLPFGLREFKNIEQIEYCVPLPLKEYTEVKSDERAKHVFKNKVNKKYQLIVQGFFREDTKMSLAEYFKKSYTNEDEEGGKIVIEKVLFKKNYSFYAIGYWSNRMYESRFLEITWLRNDDVVKLSVTYPLRDTAIWKKRLNTVVRSNSFCKG